MQHYVEISYTQLVVRSIEPALASCSRSDGPSSIEIEMAAPSVIVAPSDVIPQGPFGGTGGDPFSDGVGEVVRISITYSSDVVYSVQADYRQKTTDVFSAAIHGYKGPKEEEIKLDFVKGERLLRVIGTTAPAEGESTDLVTSLTFITNTNTYGPYGAVVGRPFQSSVHGQVVGFFGRSGGLLDSFGTFTDFSKRETEVKLDGPWGGNDGIADAFYDAPADKIKQVDVEYDGNAIISLNVTYDRGSQGYVPSKHGGGGSSKGTTKQSIVFGNDEYLARVEGTTGRAYGRTSVKSLRFITNNGAYGPFGNGSGDKFSTSSDSQILGFYGRSASALDQLGAFIGVPPSPSVEKVASFGGQGGNAFYEGRGEISQIVVTSSKTLVAKLQVTYLQGGQEFVGDVHGTGDGDVTTITLNPPGEYLKQVTGTHNTVNTGPGMKDVISSITFITYEKTTNKTTTYGPYGNPDSLGTSFVSPDFGQIVGLFGRSSESLDQIGMICFPK